MGSRITRTPRLVRLSSGLCPSSRVDSPTSAQLLRKPTIKWPRRSTRITSTLSASFCLRRRAVAMPPKPPPRINTRFIELPCSNRNQPVSRINLEEEYLFLWVVSTPALHQAHWAGSAVPAYTLRKSRRATQPPSCPNTLANSDPLLLPRRLSHL